MKHASVAALFVLLSVTASAQQTPAGPAPAEPAPARPASSTQAPAEHAPASLDNVPNLRFEIVIADEGGGAPATRKTVSVIARGDSQLASVRSQGQLNASHPISVAAKATGIGIGLNVDVRGQYVNGKIRARVTVDYQPFWPEARSLPSSVRTNVDVVLDEGRRMLIAQAADPLTDRRTTIEVTATAVK